MRLINLELQGNFGNRLIEIMVAEAIRKRSTQDVEIVLNSEVAGLSHPYRTSKEVILPDSLKLSPTGSHRIDLDELASWLSSNENAILELRGYYQRIEFIENLRGYFTNKLLSPDSSLLNPGLEGFLVINVRGGDIMHGSGGTWYFPLPFSYYEEIIADSGLPPLFIGQLDSFYADLLARRFPNALFLECRNHLYTHQILRSSPNLAIPLSTFSWTAAFLSTSLQKLYFPLAGFFKQFNASADMPCLLMNDPRVIYYDFPDFIIDITRYSDIERVINADSSCFARIGSFDNISIG